MQVLSIVAALVAAASAASLRQASSTEACLYIDPTCATEVPVVPGIIDAKCMTLPIGVCTKAPIAILTWSFIIEVTGDDLVWTRYTDDACTTQEEAVEGTAGTCVGPLANMSGMNAYAMFTFDSTAAVAETVVDTSAAEAEPEPTVVEEVVAEEVTAVEEVVAEEVTAVEEVVAEEVTAVEEVVAEEVTAVEEVVAEEVTTVDAVTETLVVDDTVTELIPVESPVYRRSLPEVEF